MRTTVSVVIPTFNRKDDLKETLQSLSNQTSRDFEVIVADDGSTDGTEQMIKQLKVPYPIKHCWHENAGRSAARNMGIKNTEGRIILFIDDHIIVDRKLVEEHIKYHNRVKNTRICTIRGRVEYISRSYEAPKETKVIPDSKIKRPFGEQNPLIIFYTNNISVTKEALDHVGGFDEDFKEYGFQDSELGYRLRKAGYRFKHNPNAVGYIFAPQIHSKAKYIKYREAGHSAVVFYRKHPVYALFNVGVNPINTLLYLIFSLNNNWWLRRTRKKLREALTKQNKKQINKFEEQQVFFYFIAGIHEKLFNKTIKIAVDI